FYLSDNPGPEKLNTLAEYLSTCVYGQYMHGLQLHQRLYIRIISAISSQSRFSTVHKQFSFCTWDKTRYDTCIPRLHVLNYYQSFESPSFIGYRIALSSYRKEFFL